MAHQKNFRDSSDEELISYYRNSHDVIYAGELYLRYARMATGVCLHYLKDREESKDAVMQIFERLLHELKRQEIKHFRPWLYTVIKNHCLMEIRKRDQTQPITENDRVFMENTGDTPLTEEEEEISRAMVIDYLKSGLRDLKPEQKNCIELFYLQNRSYKEIVQMTSYTLNDVKSHIQNGKRNLKLYIERKRHEERKQQGKLF